MFIFNLNNIEIEKYCRNYPKYMIVFNDNKKNFHFHSNSMFYYLVSSFKHYTVIPGEIPAYLIILDLYFNVDEKVVRFNLSKLGTDYIFNKICIHYQYECTGSYPDNYVFVNEPNWPYEKVDRISKTPLKGIVT